MVRFTWLRYPLFALVALVSTAAVSGCAGETNEALLSAAPADQAQADVPGGEEEVSSIEQALPFGLPQPGELTSEEGVDRPGLDFASFDLAAPQPTACAQACAQKLQCRAYTYVPPGVQGPAARCWLKWAVPNAIPAPGMVSGYRRPSPPVGRMVSLTIVAKGWNPYAGGTISSTPAGISCTVSPSETRSCTAVVPAGRVMLRALGGNMAEFRKTGCSGRSCNPCEADPQGDGTRCTVDVQADMSIDAQFWTLI